MYWQEVKGLVLVSCSLLFILNAALHSQRVGMGEPPIPCLGFLKGELQLSLSFQTHWHNETAEHQLAIFEFVSYLRRLFRLSCWLVRKILIITSSLISCFNRVWMPITAIWLSLNIWQVNITLWQINRILNRISTGELQSWMTVQG